MPGRFSPAPRAFTIVEVMIAATVLVLAITTAIVALQHGFQALDTARNYTVASQVMQSEIERLRLKSWTQVEALQRTGDTAVQIGAVAGGGATAFTCHRRIQDLRTDMKEITLDCAWRGIDGRTHNAKFVTRYAKSGLYDYFYTAH
jgi:Tfp pilus assembly protein PilV